MTRQKTKGWLAAVFVCALAVLLMMPSMPAYARSKKSRSRKSSVSSEMKMRDAAGEVQKAIDEKDLDSLASLCAYPLTFVEQSGSSREIKSKKALKSLGSKTVITKELQEAVGSVNTAKIQKDDKGVLKIGNDTGVWMKQVNNKWKVTQIRLNGQSAVAGGGLVESAEQFQRTFYYRDLETLSKQCAYPLKIYMTDGSIKEISSAQKLMELGESKVFTDDLVNQVNEVNAADLKEKDQKVQVGEICGFWMTKKSGQWKIDLIFQ